MFFEILTICITLYLLLAPLIDAKAEAMREDTRRKELETDIMEQTDYNRKSDVT